MSAPDLVFLAPPPFGDDRDDGPANTADEASSAAPHGRGPATAGLRITRGAREAATGMKVSEADIQRCLDAPDDVSPDPNTPSRTRLRRGDLTVVAGADGMVLRVNRRRR